MSISENVKRIKEQIAQAAIKSGREPGDIKLVAASKTNGADKVRQVIEAGVDAVGENRVQEMLQKHAQGAYDGAPLHFIGHLQSNKVRQVVGLCGLIESVSSEALVEVIGKRAQILGITQDVLIEVNIGREDAKSGIIPERTPDLLDFAAGFPEINVLGLMAIPPFFDKKDASGNYFDEMVKLFVDMRAKKYDNVSMRFLSMGMSDSFEYAIEAGANMVRIGSAIFGQRI